MTNRKNPPRYLNAGFHLLRLSSKKKSCLIINLFWIEEKEVTFEIDYRRTIKGVYIFNLDDIVVY